MTTKTSVVPNFYILGAPKCGTSAMHSYLVQHPNVFMSDPKEPLYWASDFPGAQRQQPGLDTFDDYLRLFEQRTSEHHIVGDASTLYLSSGVAVPRIIEFHPESRFLVMLRNPVDFAPAFHSEKLFDLYEDEEDFEVAWSLQDKRAKGRRIPQTCCQPEFLQYRTIGAFGSQVTRLQEWVCPSQCQIVLFDDFVSDTRATYVRVLDFLGLPDDGRMDFPRINERRAPRFRFLNAIYHSNHDFARRVVHTVRLQARRVPPLRSLWQRLQSKHRARTQLSAAMRQKLADAFEEEIRLLAKLLDRNLDHWLAPPSDVH